MYLWNCIVTPVTPTYLFVAVRDDGDYFLQQYLPNNKVDFKIVP